MYRLFGQIRPISLYTSKTPGQSGSPGQSESRVTSVPGRVGSRVSVTDPVPSLIQVALVASARDLGVYLDSDMTIKTQVTRLVSFCFGQRRRKEVWDGGQITGGLGDGSSPARSRGGTPLGGLGTKSSRS